ncbi:hypothetical protein QQF64_030713 [Cirrhinus molitorella]|uniref:Uncharacterized protein n=1 Tax=Cirrhinus molitorella TaxID=172907 RepID=A0ABR3N439_9TELE
MIPQISCAMQTQDRVYCVSPPFRSSSSCAVSGSRCGSPSNAARGTSDLTVIWGAIWSPSVRSHDETRWYLSLCSLFQLFFE